MKHIRKYNEMLDPMGKWSPEGDNKELISHIKSLINVGRTSVDNISNMNVNGNIVTFNALIRGVFMEGEGERSIKASLSKEYNNVEVERVKGDGYNYKISLSK